MTSKNGSSRLKVNIMKHVAHIDKKWQTSVPVYVEMTCDDGFHKYYLKGRFSGGPLTAEFYAFAKPGQPATWKRYRHLAGKPGIEVKIIDPNVDFLVVSSAVPAIKEEMQ